MVNQPSNEQLLEFLKPLKKFQSFSVQNRKMLDQSVYARLEVIDFKEIPNKSYILKSIVSNLNYEVESHRYASNYKLNGAQFIFGKADKISNLNFILMEKIDDLIPLYFVAEEDYLPLLNKFIRLIAKFHVESCNDFKLLSESGIPIYGTNKYIQILNELPIRLKVYKKTLNHPYFLPTDLLEEFKTKIDSLIKIFKSIHKTKLSLVHGDLDYGNIFIKNINEVCLLDWGLSHLDHPIIDIANLFNNLENLDKTQFNELLELYYNLTKSLYPNKLKLQKIREIGSLAHLLYFINFQLKNIEIKFIDPAHYIESIHNKITKIVELSKKIKLQN